MITTKLSQRFVYHEFKDNNEYRIGKYGVCDLCKRCIWKCKLGDALGLTNFWCRDFEDGGIK